MNNKQLSQIKELISNNKRDRFVIFNDNEPALVVMSVEEYKKIVTSQRIQGGPSDRELVENINRTIAEWKASQDLENSDDFDINDLPAELEDDFYEGDDGLSYYYDLEDE